MYISTTTFFFILKLILNLFQEHNIFYFPKLAINRILLLMYKNSEDLLPTAISSLFVRNDVYHDHYTRVSSLLYVPVGPTGLICKTFRFLLFVFRVVTFIQCIVVHCCLFYLLVYFLLYYYLFIIQQRNVYLHFFVLCTFLIFCCFVYDMYIVVYSLN